jgi:putative tricarboxylic transport membrane protein
VDGGALLTALGHLASIEAVSMLTVGVLIGLTMGVLPGLGGLATISIVLPVAYLLDPIPALALVLGAYSSTYFGGSITAILLNTPGSSEQVVTTFDGYPMTKRGEGARALGASASACFAGSIIGAIVLVVTMPFGRLAIDYVAPPEIFALGLVAICTIGVVSTGSATKGILSGLIGFMLATIGYDPITGTQRFTYGTIYLFDGLSLTALIMGLFALSEMFFIFGRGHTIAGQNGDTPTGLQWRGVLQGMGDAVRHWKTVLTGGLVGSAVGIVPGIGGTVAMFLAYAVARQQSKTPEEFGKGAVEGILGPEAANDAKEGGALVPTVLFGLPGSSAMAIFIGVFMIMGYQVGPSMVRDHLDIIYYMAWLIAAAGVLASVLGLFLAPGFAKIAHVRAEFVAASLIVIAFVGAFFSTRLFVGILIALAAGIVGYWLKKLNYSPAAIILGFVLGDVIEKNLFISLQAYGPAFMLRPLVAVVLIAGLVIVGLPYLRIWLAARRRSRTAHAGEVS